MDLKLLQKPLKDRYRADPSASQITLRAEGSPTGGSAGVPVSCTVDIGRAAYEAQAHAGVGGPGTAGRSGDLLLGALAACAQISCQMVAAAMGIPTREIRVSVEGSLDLRGTLGLSRDVPVGFEEIRVRLALDAPDATPEQLEALHAKTEQYCVVMQTLRTPPPIRVDWIEKAGPGGRHPHSCNK
jgi:uncharacterized OsmC-like protein